MKLILRSILLGAMLLVLLGIAHRTTCERCQPPDCTCTAPEVQGHSQVPQGADEPAPTLAPRPAAPSLAVQTLSGRHRPGQVIYVTVEAEEVASDR